MDATCPAPGLQNLIEKAETDLFPSVTDEQRTRLAQAWANFRHGAALLSDIRQGRVARERLHEALLCGKAGIEALLALAPGSLADLGMNDAQSHG